MVVSQRPAEVDLLQGDAAKARKVLGWQPKVDFRKGVEEVVKWVEANWNEIQGESLVYVHKAA